MRISRNRRLKMNVFLKCWKQSLLDKNYKGIATNCSMIIILRTTFEGPESLNDINR